MTTSVPFGSLLSKIIDNRGKTCPTSEAGIPLIATNCIKNEHLYPVYEKVRYVSQEVYDSWFRGHPEPGDLIFVLKGTPGRVNWVNNPVDFCIAQDMVALRVDENKVYPKYLFAVLRSSQIQQEIEGLHVGSLIPHFKKSDFDDLQIPLVEEKLQKYIGDVYFNLSLKIDLLHRQNKTLEAMAETLLIQHVLPREDEQNDGLYLLGDYLETISVTHKFPNPQVVFLNTSDIYKGKVLTHELSEVKGLPGQAKKSIKKGDILFSEIRPANGRYALIDFDADNYVVSTKLMVLRAKQPNLIGLLYFYLTNKQVTDWLQVLAESRSGTFPQITFDQVADLELRLPQGSDLDNLIGLLDDILLKQSANNKQIQTLENLRDTLLPKLMSGEVRVQYQTEEVA
ncbi:restriction endonuclease subunit S [Acinetobacter baumannii]|uniref:restriction endonuclease subunit S n=1 Tax=Acinetobacter baumannii TaxID=470 RepID=UPI000D334CD5|nr:restriction endonuclease subunit S [Acinetobacter baumannii]PUU96593.1 hypothetical protein DCD75_14325 [Acinetobacter baumannii]